MENSLVAMQPSVGGALSSGSLRHVVFAALQSPQTPPSLCPSPCLAQANLLSPQTEIQAKCGSEQTLTHSRGLQSQPASHARETETRLARHPHPKAVSREAAGSSCCRIEHCGSINTTSTTSPVSSRSGESAGRSSDDMHIPRGNPAPCLYTVGN